MNLLKYIYIYIMEDIKGRFKKRQSAKITFAIPSIKTIIFYLF